ncbi:hypothetical protein CAP40_06010 [Sphingomonas sp. IBVSS2]|uniref:hypothetical protein n=1 Tax=Sphingomonas sp. IBVSS2 TaxID=1985172 RepID=UPI000A2D6416|nr:hypothetical protein [Sphingomonas sp. IBVSS2]OSZ68149.1 hypothetical protein CAP40_06010 [Sphingomonas sp. IBVSS2]
MFVKILRFLSFAFALSAPLAAQAYTGPGLGLGAIGVAFGLIGSILLAIVSVVWYPIKRLVRRIRGRAR